MRVGIVVSGFPPEWTGGTEHQARDLAKNLAKKGHDVVVFTRSHPKRKDGEKRDKYVIRRVRFVNIPVLRYVSFVAKAKALIKKEHAKKPFDFLHCMFISPNGLVGALIKKKLGIPLAVGIRGNKFYTKTGLEKFLSNFVLRNADLILKQTEGQKKELLSLYPWIEEEKVVVIPNGFGLKSREGTRPEKLIYFGRLTRMKGVTYLIDALSLMKEKPETLIFGDGPEMKELKKQAEKLPVKFFGYQPHSRVQECMSKGNIFVLPSLYGEGFPNTILEAMSCGLPVITTDLPGMSDIVINEKTGMIVPKEDPRALAKAIEHLVKAKEVRKEMSKACLEEVDNYSWKKIVGQYEKAYKGINKA